MEEYQNKNEGSRLDRIEEKLNLVLDSGNKKKKEFKLPLKGKISNKKARDNWVTIMKINENGVVDFKREQIKEQTTMVDDVPRLASSEHVLIYKKKPIIIQPSWSTVPFSPRENYKNTLEKGSNIAGYRLLMNRMQTETAKIGKKIGGLGIGIGALIIIGIIVYALVTG